MKSFFNSFYFAIKGISMALVSERNLKIQSFTGMVTIGAGFYFNISTIEWCIILFTIALVLGMELVNTAIEKTVDLITMEQNPLAGKIKDIAAGAVLVTAIAASIIGIIIFSKYLG